MKFDAFTAGISPGGLRSSADIKLLICYIFSSVGDSVSKNEVIEAIQLNNLANYFEVNAAFSDLLENGNLIEDKDSGMIRVTEKGKMISDQLETTLPLSVREQALSATINVLSHVKMKKENHVEIKQDTKGYSVTCRIPDGDVELFSFSVHLPDRLQADLVEKNFYENPEIIYKFMLAVITKNKGLVKGIFEDYLK